MDEQDASMRGHGSRLPSSHQPSGAVDDPGNDESQDPISSSDLSQIRSEIAQTRADIGDTVDAIQDRLKPGNVVSRTVGSVRDATARKVRQMTMRENDEVPRRAADWYRGNGVLQRVRENPIPAAIAVGSLAWLAFAKQSSRDYAGPPPYGSSHGADMLSGRRRSDWDVDVAGDEDQPREALQRAKSAALETGQRVRDTGARARRRVKRLARENTFTAGIIAAGVGLAIGFALPETQRENEMLGEARDAMLDRAKSAARDAVDQVQRTADTVKRAAGTTVRWEGSAD